MTCFELSFVEIGRGVLCRIFTASQAFPVGEHKVNFRVPMQLPITRRRITPPSKRQPFGSAIPGSTILMRCNPWAVGWFFLVGRVGMTLKRQILNLRGDMDSCVVTKFTGNQPLRNYQNVINRQNKKLSCRRETARASCHWTLNNRDSWPWKGHWMSFRIVPSESLGAVSYSPFIVTMAVSLTVYEIFNVNL